MLVFHALKFDILPTRILKLWHNYPNICWLIKTHHIPWSSSRAKTICPTATRGVQAGDITEVRGQKAWCHQTPRRSNWVYWTLQDWRTLLMVVSGWRLGTRQIICVGLFCMCLCMITHISCDLTQGPDGVYSLYGVVGNNERGLTTAEHYRHGWVRCILNTGAFKKTWKHTANQFKYGN